MSAEFASLPSRHPRTRPGLLLGAAAVLLLLHLLHFADVLGLTDGTPLAFITRIVRANMTPLAWLAYVFLLCGFLTLLDGRTWLRRFRNRFAVLWLFSVTAWCYFDWMNFYFMRDPATGLRAWEYIHMPERFRDRLLGYLIAFGAILPGMFLSAEVCQRAGFHRIRLALAPQTTAARNRALPLAVFLLGLVLAPIPILIGRPISNLAVWVGTWALLDPINFRFGRPSIVGDWLRGRFGRTLALGAGGLWCGFLWEFWNFWAVTKWQYHLPFLGSWEHVKYFEMPVPGLVGFIAFGIQTWTMWQTALLLLAPFVEGERHSPADQTLAAYGCV
jgi:hypothetical protein